MNPERVNELLLQALETESGGIRVYETALRCARNEQLRDEWAGYLEQTREHERIVRELLQRAGVDAGAMTPGREVVKHLGESLVTAMEMALAAGDADAAQLVAAECVVLAETKDHQNWELIGQLVRGTNGAEPARGAVLKAAHERVEDQEDEHLYHSAGWCRELWIEALGLPAVLPPPEEERDVKTAIAAARAKQSRTELL